MNFELLFQLVLNGIIVGTLYGVVAMCFVLIYKSTEVVNFAQGEFLLVGAWACWWLMTTFELGFVLGFIVTLTALPCDLAVALLAGRVQRFLERRGGVSRTLDRLAGGILIGLGLLVAFDAREPA